MIYFDNAATTKYKPEEVYKAFDFYVREVGVSPGRGSYQIGIQASRMLFQTRRCVANFFGLKSSNVIFTKNSTEAINLFLKGFLNEGDHVVISCYEHNSVLRPLNKLKEERNIKYSVINRDDLQLKPKEIFEKYVNPNTVLFISTLASNLTGRIVYSKELTSYMKHNGLTTFIDSSQGAGKIRISMQEQDIDYLAFTGHKDLMALPGVGGLCCSTTPHWSPLLQGGTGVLGDMYSNPDIFPEGYEVGTMNMPAIWALNKAICYLQDNFDLICKQENKLKSYLVQELRKLDNVIVYDDEYERVPTIALNVRSIKSSNVISILDKNNICCRGGIHCAVLAHEALGTKEVGAVRVSLNYFNSIEEIDKLLNVLSECR